MALCPSFTLMLKKALNSIWPCDPPPGPVATWNPEREGEARHEYHDQGPVGSSRLKNAGGPPHSIAPLGSDSPCYGPDGPDLFRREGARKARPAVAQDPRDSCLSAAPPSATGLNTRRGQVRKLSARASVRIDSGSRKREHVLPVSVRLNRAPACLQLLFWLAR